jgi:hypothetical protein
VIRGSLAAAVATFTAAFSHVAAGGATPAPGAVVLSFALSALVSIALAGRALSFGRTALAVGASQALFHGLFSTIGSSATMTMSTHAGHDGSSLVATVDPGQLTAGHSGWMWAGHAVAAVITVALIRHGERALALLRECASLIFARLVASPPAPAPISVPTPRVGGSRTIRAIERTFLVSGLRHRGPPAIAA